MYINNVHSQYSFLLCMAMCAYPDVTCNRQYEEKQLKGQQAREEKRLEFANLQQRLQNQLDFEKQKNPAGVCVCARTNPLYYVWLFDDDVTVSATVRKYARTIATDEKSIAELKREEKDKEKVWELPTWGTHTYYTCI